MLDATYSPSPGLTSRLRNGLRALALLFPLTARLKVRIYYDIFTDVFEIMTERSDLFNYGQEALCRRTVAELPRPGRWLDVGCGVGGPACLLAGETPDVEIVGINISRPQIARARNKCAARGLAGRVRIEFGDACSMPFSESALFDGLYAIETAMHFPDKAAFAREAHRVLRPGAKFACADMVLAEGEGVPLAQRLFGRVMHRWIGVLRMHTVRRWQEDLGAAGFSDIRVEDLTPTVLRDGLRMANAQIDKMRPVLDERFPRFLIDAVRWANVAVVRDIKRQPVRYFLITAQA